MCIWNTTLIYYNLWFMRLSKFMLKLKDTKTETHLHRFLFHKIATINFVSSLKIRYCWWSHSHTTCTNIHTIEISRTSYIFAGPKIFNPFLHLFSERLFMCGLLWAWCYFSFSNIRQTHSITGCLKRHRYVLTSTALWFDIMNYLWN